VSETRLLERPVTRRWPVRERAPRVSGRPAMYTAFAQDMALLNTPAKRRWLVGLLGVTAAAVFVLPGDLLTLLAVAFAVVAGFFLQERLAGFWQYDPTVSLRTQSLRLAWSEIVQPNWVMGVGYNAYQFAAQEAGIIGGFTIHSRAGADNSWLTIWATTGIIGVMLFLLPWIVVVRHLASSSLLLTVCLLPLATLFVHSQFVNSFLYSHLLITLAIIVTLTLASASRSYEASI
jgi:hypothetical protein